MFIDMKNLIFYKKIFQNIDIIYEDLNLIALNKKKKAFSKIRSFFFNFTKMYKRAKK